MVWRTPSCTMARRSPPLYNILMLPAVRAHSIFLAGLVYALIGVQASCTTSSAASSSSTPAGPAPSASASDSEAGEHGTPSAQPCSSGPPYDSSTVFPGLDQSPPVGEQEC